MSADDDARRSQDDMRAAIIDASCRIGDEEGESGLTMRNIAGRVGVSATMLYEYFVDKAALRSALQERVRETFLTRLADELDVTSDPSDRLLRLCTSYVALAHRSPWQYALAFGEVPLALLQDPREGLDPFVDRAAAHLTRLFAHQPHRDPLSSAIHLRVVVHGLASVLCRRTARGIVIPEIDARFAEAHFRLWLAGLLRLTEAPARVDRGLPTSDL